MASFTRLGFVRQATAENDEVWGEVHNQGFVALADEAIAGRADVDVTSANVTLDDIDGASDNSRPMHIHVAGSNLVNRTLFVPTRQKLYIVRNESTAQLIVRTLLGLGELLDIGASQALVVDEVKDQVLPISLGTAGGAGTVSPAPATGQFFAAEWRFATSGLTNPNVAYSSQGNIGMMYIPLTQTGVNIDSTTFVLDVNDPDFTLLPVFPTRSQDLPLVVYENLVRTPCYARVRNNGTGIEFFKADGAPWILPSFRKFEAGGQFYVQFSTASLPIST